MSDSSSKIRPIEVMTLVGPAAVQTIEVKRKETAIGEDGLSAMKRAREWSKRWGHATSVCEAVGIWPA